MNIHECVEKWQSEDGVGFFTQMDFPRNSVYLDCGCGYGEYTVALAQSDLTSTVYAIDTNIEKLKIVEEKIAKIGIANVKLLETDFIEGNAISGNYADVVLMYDLIHSNNKITKMPMRFDFIKAAKRILKPNAILSIAPFHCTYLKDINGKGTRYSLKKLINEIEEYGFTFNKRFTGAIHFVDYHKSSQWEKFNGDMPFEHLERGITLNFYANDHRK